MIRGRPNFDCHYCKKSESLRRDGFYFRKNDSRYVSRYYCTACNKRFSSATSTLEARQKKRRVNHVLFKLLASGISMRRSALLLKIHRTTVKRKLIYLANKCRLEHGKFLRDMANEQKVTALQFDDLITIEHTKLKPLSVTAAIDAERRLILGAEVSRIPAFGHLAALSRKKYGRRKSEHARGMRRLFSAIKNVVDPHAQIESDESQFYPKVVREFFPKATHVTYKGGRGAVVGQGELKKLKYDPLFALNHTYAMFRANINRLFRKTWCTTKDPAMLSHHLAIYIGFHNNFLIGH